MKKILSDRLNEEFPELYRGRHLSIQENLMPFGFECGDGWFGLLWNLSNQIRTLDPDGHVMAAQVKEKFGTLRFYIDAGSDEIYEAIHHAMRKSSKICESCGNPGTYNKDGGYWISVRCLECRKVEQDARRDS